MSNFSRNREDIANLILQHGLTPTAQRVDIGEVLLNKPQHLSADDILSKANQNMTKVSKATVYNTLKLFLSHGLVNEVKVTKQYTIYDSVVEAHHHIYNEDTGELFDLNSEQIRINGLPELAPGLVTRGVDVLVRVGNS